MAGPKTRHHQLVIFGGEYTSPTQTRFSHYADTWSLKFPAVSAEAASGARGWGSSAEWVHVANDSKAAAGTPTPRSGHRAILVEHRGKRSMVVFGGFYDNGREVRSFFSPQPLSAQPSTLRPQHSICIRRWCVR
jgi:hypothetical protein